MKPTPRSIRTPDQRLRVFVSSTLQELADERKAVRTAVERLRLAPVMFELGARPHPPRDLYRSYLEQSDVFVGLYWQRYGWVAPGESVSGLEDEYLLAPDIPKLIYFKQPATAREPRLTELLNRIRNDDTVSFKYFETARELRQLVEADLATLLAERFDQSRSLHDAPPLPAEPPTVPVADLSAMPNPLTELVGRERELTVLEGMLRRNSVRLVTLTGSGGIGKSRLAIAVADRVADAFGEMAFVDLASVQDPALVVAAIARALGVRDTGDEALDEKLKTALRARKMLVIVDNFEQVLEAAPVLTELLAAAPGLTILVTSRAVLHLSGEHTFEVGPLGLPRPAALTVEEAFEVPSVALFVERARAVKPEFNLTPDNLDAVARICMALDGVPLALELAAARIRILPPSAMLARLDRQLPLLAGGIKDLPLRQQALRSTIEWSTQLLGTDEKDLLSRLGVFSGGFSLEAAEFVSESDSTLDLLGALVDNSLVRQQDRGESSYFSLLATVREYAWEQLEATGVLPSVRARHAAYYLQLGQQSASELKGAGQTALISRLSEDHDNLRAAIRFLLDQRDWETASRFAWSLYIYWWVGGHLGEVRGSMEEVLGAGDELPDLTRAIALYFTRAITFWQEPDERVIPGLTESAELFSRGGNLSGEAFARISLALALLVAATPDPERADDELETSLRLFREGSDRWGEAFALVTLGRVALLQQKVHSALDRFEESLALTRRQEDPLGTTVALHHIGWARLLLGEIDAARSAFEECLTISARLGHVEGVAYGLEGLVAIAASVGDADRVGRLFGASESLRQQTGSFNAQSFSFHQQFVDQIKASDRAGEYAAGLEAGRIMPLSDAVGYALSGTGADGSAAADAAARPPAGR